MAEFIVGMALGVVHGGVRIEWDEYDLLSPQGLKLEVKSSAFIQTWNQQAYSKPEFSISPKKSGERSADIYVFCVLHHKDQSTLDALDLSQWTFYVTTRQNIDDKLPTQQTIKYSVLEAKLGVTPLTYAELADAIIALGG
jgi:hypothetical protein